MPVGDPGRRRERPQRIADRERQVRSGVACPHGRERTHRQDQIAERARKEDHDARV
jgi:hypothetical protein